MITSDTTIVVGKKARLDIFRSLLHTCMQKTPVGIIDLRTSRNKSILTPHPPPPTPGDIGIQDNTGRFL